MTFIKDKDKIKGSVKIPLNPERLAVLVGPKGEVKKKLEEATKTRIKIDSNNYEAIISPTAQSSIDGILKAKLVIEAINTGFNPNDAFELLKEDVILEKIDLKEYTRRREDIIRIKGRIIGEKGRFWRNLEEMTGAKISVYDRYVGIIGDFNQVQIVRQAILMIIRGRQHSTVLRYVRKALQEQAISEFIP